MPEKPRRTVETFGVPADVAQVIEQRMGPVIDQVLASSRCGKRGFFESAILSAYLQGFADAQHHFAGEPDGTSNSGGAVPPPGDPR